MVVLQPVRVVFIHGLFSSKKVWARFEQLIKSDADLAPFVTISHFQYESPFMRFRPDRRIASIDDIADRLRTYLLAELRDVRPLVLVSHSQGGLIVQRFLARTLQAGRGQDLQRIKRIVMFACPNSGSEFALPTRKLAVLWRHPHEQQLRPFTSEIAETQRIVLRAIIGAKRVSDAECPIPIESYGGLSDKVVPPETINFVIPLTGVVDGDHFSIVRPKRNDTSSYRLLKNALLTMESQLDKELPGETEMGNGYERQPAPVMTSFDETAELRGRVSVAPPVGKRRSKLRGRDDLIASVLSSHGSGKVHILAGLGGCGKTRLALEIADRVLTDGWQVWWVSAVRINSCMREIANQVGAPDAQVERAWRGGGSAIDLVWRYLDQFQGQWLLVFDNADDSQQLGSLDAPVSDGTGWLRQPRGDGMVIVTSRDRNADTWGGWSTVHEVLPLGDDDGALMLTDLLGASGGSFDQARQLSAELGGLPQALYAAATCIKSVVQQNTSTGATQSRSLSDYLDLLRQRFEEPISSQGRDLSETLGLEVIQEVSDLSLDLLARRGLSQARPLLKVFSCLNIAPIPYRIMLNETILAGSPLFVGITAKGCTAILQGLSDLGLVEFHVLSEVDSPELSHVLSLHPAIHGVLREEIDVRRRRDDYYRVNVRMLLSATKSFNPDFAENWIVWHVIAPHAVEICRATMTAGTEPADRSLLVLALDLARLTCRYLIVAGLLAPADRLIEPIIANCGSFRFTENDKEILALRHERARIALARGEPEAAEAELRRVIAGRERLLGPNDPDTLASNHKLAKAILEQGRFAEAEPLLRLIVSAEQDVRGPLHSDTIVVRHSLARAVLAQHRATEAEDMLRDIVQISASLWSAATPETLFARQTLARSLLEQNKAAEAEQEVRDALRQAAAYPDNPMVLSLRHTLTLALLMRGAVSDAVTQLRSLLSDRRRVLGPGHSDTERTGRLLERAQNEIPDGPMEGSL